MEKKKISTNLPVERKKKNSKDSKVVTPENEEVLFAENGKKCSGNAF